MLVYDITNEKSFDNIKNWIRNIEEVRITDCISTETMNHVNISLNLLHFTQHASADVEKMILGNKCDINEKRQVSKDRGEKVRDAGAT